MRGVFRRRLPEVLLVAGLLLAAGAGLAVLVTRERRRPAPHHARAATTTAPATVPSTTTRPAAAPTSETPTRLRVTGVTGFGATVSWHTRAPTVGRVAFGPASLGETRWLAPTPLSVDHQVTLGGFAFSTDYRVDIVSTGGGGQAEATLDVTTSGAPSTVRASTAHGAILLDGQPWFPLLEYGQCSTLYDSSVGSGITLFAANPCGGLQAQLDALSGRALSAGVSGEPGGSGPGLIGTFYPDEADGHGYTGARLPSLPAGLGLLTLTSHFYSGADPLPSGRSVYPGLVARADVIGFDLYPLQGWCQGDRLADVFAAQRELVALARGKPTFQWIEAAGMNCPTTASLVPSPATVRAEAWLAIAGGAHGLGFFPAAWTGDVGGAISRVAAEVAGLAPAILEAPRPGVEADATVRAAAWSVGETVYVAAVNSGTTSTHATVRVPELAGRLLDVLEESRRVSASGDSFADDFGPLAVHLYVARPAGT